jgi:hypothetical protein
MTSSLTPSPGRTHLMFASPLHYQKHTARRVSILDEVPVVVALPVGTYTLVARSERGGYAGMLVVIKEGKQVVLDLDLWETKTQRSLVHN